MRLTMFTDYALRTLMYLSQHQERLCTAREVADSYGVSLNHIVKVVHRLSQLGYIKSVKGKGGGIKLNRPPEEINLWELVKSMEPDLTLVECFDPQHNTCRVVSACGLKSILHEAMQAFEATLMKYSIADTISKPRLFSSLTLLPEDAAHTTGKPIAPPK